MKKQTYIRNLAVSCLTLMALTTLTPVARAHPNTVEVHAGSVNTLAAAIASAGPGGTVILQTGLHSESGEVVVTFPVNIISEDGAILETATSPTVGPVALAITAALHFKGAPGSTVRGVWFRPPAGTTGNCGVILEDSPGAKVLHNRMTALQYGVFVQRADYAVIHGNTLSISTDGLLGLLPDTEGIISNAGEHVQVTDNQVSGALFGIFASGRSGTLAGNTLTGNFYGIFTCHNYDIDPFYYTFSGSPQFGPQPATAWEVHNNTVHGNGWGIIVTDGSHQNLIWDNKASRNGDPLIWGTLGYDVELTGDTTRWGFPASAGYDNHVVQNGEGQKIVVKDCGNGSTVEGNGVSLVDTAKDPCY